MHPGGSVVLSPGPRMYLPLAYRGIRFRPGTLWSVPPTKAGTERPSSVCLVKVSTSPETCRHSGNGEAHKRRGQKLAMLSRPNQSSSDGDAPLLHPECGLFSPMMT
jgi:hypothetical protein